MMKYFEKHPMVMIVIGVLGISMSAIFVKYSSAPSVVTAAYRLLWTVALMAPVTLGKSQLRRELLQTSKKDALLAALSGVFLALHFTAWFESLNQTSVASSTAIVCTEVIWVALGYCLFMRGRLSPKAVLCIGLTLAGSVLIAFSDYSAGDNHVYGDLLSLAAAVFVAVYTLIGREVRSHMSTVSYTFICYSACALCLVIGTLASGLSLAGCGLGSVVVGLLLAVFSTLLGHSIFSWCLKFFSPAFVSASKLCEPVVAAVFAVFLFQEIPAPLQVVGGAITIGSVLLYSRVERDESAPPSQRR